MQTILTPLVERLRAVPPCLWESIAREAGCAVSLPRKLVYGDRENPRVQTVQPLFDYFRDVDAGLKLLPTSPTPDLAQQQAA